MNPVCLNLYLMKKVLLKIGKLTGIACVMAMLFSGTVFADKYWVGNYTGCGRSWDDGDCWASVAGGMGGAGVPGSSDVAFFTIDDTRNCAIDGDNVDVSGIRLEPGFDGRIRANSSYSVTVGSDRFLQRDGIFQLNGADMINSDSFYVYGGLFDAGNGDFSAKDLYFNYFSPRDGDADFSASSSLDLSGSFIFGSDTDSASGNFDAPAVMNIGGTFYSYSGNSSFFEAGVGKVVFDGSSAAEYIKDDVNFNDLEINKTSGGSLTLKDDIDINGSLNIVSGTLYAGNNTLYLDGDLIDSGSSALFNSGTGTVILDGDDQSIMGNNAFNHLEKDSNSASVLTFEAGKTQTILGNLTLIGDSGGLLSLRSSVDGAQWRIDPQSGRTFAYVDVKDSNNINFVDINASGVGAVDSENNTKWFFDEMLAQFYLDAMANFNGTLFAGMFETVGTIYSKVAPFTSSWQIDARPAGAERLLSFATFKGALYSGGDQFGRIFKRSDQGFDLYSNADIVNGQYTHVAMLYDKDLPSAKARLYLNGEFDASVDYSSTALDSNSLDLLIGDGYGSSLGGNNASGEEAFDGEIDEIRLSSGLRSSGWLKTSYNTMNSPSTFVGFGEEERKPEEMPLFLLGGGEAPLGLQSGPISGTKNSTGISGSIGAGKLTIVSGGGLNNGINLNAGPACIEANSVTWAYSETSDYINFEDSSNVDGFRVNLFLSSSDGGNFVYSGTAIEQESIPMTNLSIYGGYSSSALQFVAPDKGVDDITKTLNINSASTCDTGENLNLYTFHPELEFGDYGLTMSRTAQAYLTSAASCLTTGSVDIRGVKLIIPPAYPGGTYRSTLYIVIVDGQ